MCHGFTGHKGEDHRLFVTAAREFARSRLVVLRFDFRGSGDSDGAFSEMTVSGEIEDATAALDFLTAQPEVDADRIGVLGLSLGGCVAACLAGRDERVKALVLWAAVARPDRLYERLALQSGGEDVLDYGGWGVGRRFVQELPRIRPLEEVGRYRGPSFVVHGASDESVPVSDAGDYRLALGGRCETHLMKDADHVFSTLKYTGEAVRLSRQFLVESLRAEA